MKFRLDLKIFIFLILFYFTRQIEIYAYIMFFCIVHEFGHLLAGLVLGMKPKSMEIMPFGVSIHFNLTTYDYNKKILKSNFLELKKIFVAIAGPLTNIIIILFCIFSNVNISNLNVIVYSNLIIALFNLLPIYPLDGGRICKCICRLIFGSKKAEILVNEISHFMVIFMTIVCSILIYYFANIGILLGLSYLWYLDVKQYKSHKLKMRMYEILSK